MHGLLCPRDAEIPANTTINNGNCRAAVCFGTGLFCTEWRKGLTAGLLPPSPSLVASSTAAPLPAHPGCSYQISARPALPTTSPSQCDCGHRGHAEVPVHPSSSSWAVLEVSLQPWGLCREKPESTVLWHHVPSLPALRQLPQHRTAGARLGCREGSPGAGSGCGGAVLCKPSLARSAQLPPARSCHGELGGHSAQGQTLLKGAGNCHHQCPSTAAVGAALPALRALPDLAQILQGLEPGSHADWHNTFSIGN